MADSSTETGANTHQWEKINGTSQQWRLLPVGAAVEFTAPNAPANLTGTSNTSPIHLTWDASTSSDVAGYTVFRAEQGGAYNTIARNVTSTSYDDYSVVSGKQYYYKVNAVDHSLNRSVNSNEAGPLTAGGEGEVWLEAECGNVGSLWDTSSDSSAANDQYVTIQSGNNSVGNAPSSTSGHITYDFNVSGGTYNLWARVITPANTDDSFWIIIDDGSWLSWNDLGSNAGWTWLKVQNYNLTDGSHTLTIAYREDGALLDKLYIGNSIPADEGTAASNCVDSEVWLEAECGNVGSLWDTPSDENASNDQYATIQSGNNSTGSAPGSASGHISYDFNVSGGTYNLWTRVITPADTDDSFWIRMDGGSWLLWNGLGSNTNWTWLEVQSYYLTDGNHTLTIAYREDGTLLDKLYIGNSAPSGEGSAATNCNDSTTTLTIQENETGFCSVDGSIDSDHTGYTGTGFANTSNATGTGVTWSVNIPSDGTYNLVWRYANGGSTDRPGQLMVDGSIVSSSVSMPSTGTWTSWSSTSEVSVTLSVGTKLIRLEATTSAGLSNIDYISITGVDPAGVGCDGSGARVSVNEDSGFSVSQDLSVYPNPVAGDMINVSGVSSANADARVMIFDNAGRIISESEPALIEKGKFDMPVNVAGLKPGLYLIKIILGPDVKTKAFIKR